MPLSAEKVTPARRTVQSLSRMRTPDDNYQRTLKKASEDYGASYLIASALEIMKELEKKEKKTDQQLLIRELKQLYHDENAYEDKNVIAKISAAKQFTTELLDNKINQIKKFTESIQVTEENKQQLREYAMWLKVYKKRTYEVLPKQKIFLVGNPLQKFNDLIAKTGYTGQKIADAYANQADILLDRINQYEAELKQRSSAVKLSPVKLSPDDPKTPASSFTAEDEKLIQLYDAIFEKIGNDPQIKNDALRLDAKEAARVFNYIQPLLTPEEKKSWQVSQTGATPIRFQFATIAPKISKNPVIVIDELLKKLEERYTNLLQKRDGPEPAKSHTPTPRD